MPSFTTSVNILEKIHNSYEYLGYFMVMTVSQSPFSSLTYTSRQLRGLDCFTDSTLCMYSVLTTEGMSAFNVILVLCKYNSFENLFELFTSTHFDYNDQLAEMHAVSRSICGV